MTSFVIQGLTRRSIDCEIQSGDEMESWYEE